MANPGLRLCGAVVASLVTAGCGGPPAPVAPRPEPAVIPILEALPDRNWGVVESSRFFVSFPLPDFAAWRIDDAAGRWLVATHLPSKSMLFVREWRTGSVVSHGACEIEARPWRPDLFGPDATTLVDRRPLPAPPGFDSEVGFAVHRVKDALGGVAIAVGANVRQCLVLAYVTRAEGSDAPRLLAERLAFVTERVFSRVETRKIDDRVVPVERRQAP